MACDDEEDVYKRPAYEPYRAICGIENGRENIAWIRDTIQTAKDSFKEDKTMLFFEIYKAELNGMTLSCLWHHRMSYIIPMHTPAKENSWI